MLYTLFGREVAHPPSLLANIDHYSNMKEQIRIIRSILLVILIITSYYVLRAGYNAFVTSREAENFQVASSTRGPLNKGTCSDIEYAQINNICTFDLLGAAATKPMTPQLKKVNALFANLPFNLSRFASSKKKVAAANANDALLRLLSYINERRTDMSIIRFRNMIKCLFYTCSSNVKGVADLTQIITDANPIFSGAPKRSGPVAPSTAPAADLETVLSFLDTRSSALEEPAFFKLLRDNFMEPTTTAQRSDIPFGKLSQLVNPQRIFQV